MLSPKAPSKRDLTQAKNPRQLNVRLLAPTYQFRYTTILKLIEKSGVVLDLGCADGFYSRTLAGRGAILTGVDNNESYLDTSKPGGNPLFKLADATELPFEDNSFDTVLCSEMLEHVTRDKAVIKEIYRVLKPSGRLLISVPSADFPFTYDPINFLLKKSGKHLPIGIWSFGHLRIYNAQDLKSLLEDVGFETEQIIFLTHALAAFFENYLSTIFQGFATREKVRRHVKAPLGIAAYFYRLGYMITAKINSFDSKLLAKSHTSVGFMIVARK